MKKIRDLLHMPSTSVCVKDSDGTVVMQNELCNKLCGKKLKTICTDGCMRLYREDPLLKSGGMRLFRAETLSDGAAHDVFLLKEKNHLISLIYSGDTTKEAALLSFKECGLNKREIEVALLALKGKTRKEIARELFVSFHTIKTHLNNIYKKLQKKNPEHWFMRRLTTKHRR